MHDLLWMMRPTGKGSGSLAPWSAVLAETPPLGAFTP